MNTDPTFFKRLFDWNFDWEYGRWNSGLYHHGALGRWGWIGISKKFPSLPTKYVWCQSDKEFMSGLPRWLKTDSELKGKLIHES